MPQWKTIFRSRLAVRMGISLGLLVGLVWGAGYWAVHRYPLELSEYRTSRTLRSAGARLESAPYGGRMVRGWVRDFCAPGDSACRCVALVHGLGDRATTWKRLLLTQPEEWSKSLRLLAIDLPGSGESEAPASSEGYRITELARAVSAFIRARPGCGSVWLVGNSMGGGVVVMAALQADNRVRRLVLLSPGGMEPPSEGSFVSSGQPLTEELLRRVAARELLRIGTVSALKEFQARAYAHPHPLPDYVWEAAARRIRESSSSDILSAQRPEDFIGGRVAEIQIPSVILWGLADRVTPLEEARPWLSKLRFSRLQEVKECGHLPQKECPLEVMGALNSLLNAGAGG